MTKEEVKKELHKKQEEYNLLKGDINQRAIYLASLKEEISGYCSTLSRIKKENKGVTITDHAIVRYLERVEGLNISEIKKHIASSETIDSIRFMKGKGKLLVDDYILVVEDYSIVTVLNNV